VQDEFCEDEVCEDCGGVIGGGCPSSTDAERDDYAERHPDEDEAKDEDVECEILHCTLCGERMREYASAFLRVGDCCLVEAASEYKRYGRDDA
jgi:predicted kinase